MKIIKTVSFIFFLVILNSPTIFPKPPVIEIKLSKNVYLESEPIWTEINVNIDKEIKVDKTPAISAVCGDIKFVLRDEINDTIKGQECTYDYVYTGYSYHLGHYYWIGDVLSIYGKYEDFPNSQLIMRRKLLSGSYKLSAIIYLIINKKAEKYYSNEIQFRVEEPFGIEIEAHKQLIEIEDFAVNGDTDKSVRFKGMCKKVNDFKGKYSYSAYLGKAENEIFSWGVFFSNFKDTITNYIFNRLSENPENYYNIRYVHSLGYLFKGDEVSLRDTLTQISKSSRGTLLQKIIDNFLEEKEALKQFEIKKN